MCSSSRLILHHYAFLDPYNKYLMMRRRLEALWAHRISRHGTTKVTPFELVYGQEVVLPMEVNLAKQNKLPAIDYQNLMMDSIDKVTNKRLQSLKEIEKDKS
jgi:hypothetical protein